MTEALRSLDVRTAVATEHYLVDLLVGFAAAERAQDMHTPFVEQLGKALSVNGPERASRMRSLGDAALFVSGFLADSFTARGVTQTYVIAIGARAYGEVSRVRSSIVFDAGPDTEVFVELAGRFEAFSRVLDEVREQTAMCTDGELVRIYERWCTTRSPELFRRLHRRGVGALQPKPSSTEDDSN
ncbi:MAG: hypothetical protein ABW321_04730 [Polyangiales bacterium]